MKPQRPFFRSIIKYGLPAVGVLALVSIPLIERYAEYKLPKLLSSYVTTQCKSCEFTLEKVDFDILGLSLEVESVAIKEDGVARVSLHRGEASISLNNIFSREILIEEVLLSGGRIQGLSPESQLSKLMLSEKKEGSSAPLVSVTLQHLLVKDFEFVHDLGVRSIRAEAIGAEVVRDEDDNYSVSAAIGNLTVVSDDTAPLRLGSLKTAFTFKSGVLDVKEAVLKLSESWVKAQMVLKDSKLSGEVKHHLVASSFGLGDRIEATIDGEAKIGGTTDAPKVTGHVLLPSESDFSLVSKDQEQLLFNTLTGEYEVRAGEATTVEIPALRAAGPLASVTLHQPVVYTSKQISGQVIVSVTDVSHSGLEIGGTDLILTLSGTPSSPRATATGTLNRLIYKNVPIGPLGFEVSFQDQKARVSMVSPDEPRRINLEAEIYFDPEPHMKGDLALRSFAIRSANDRTLIVSGGASLSGPLNLEKLQGTLSMEAELPRVGAKLKTDLNLKEGIISGNASGLDDAMRCNLKVNLKGTTRSEIHLVIDGLSLQKYDPRFHCGTLSGQADYAFDINNPIAGEGAILLQEGSIGCAPTLFQLKTPHRIGIKDGTANLGRMEIASGNSRARVFGKLSNDELDIRLDGVFPVSTILPFVPAVDSADGEVKLRVKIAGSVENPRLDGTVSIANGAIILSQVRLFARQINGNLSLSDNSIQIEKMSGIINNGRFEITGILTPGNFEQSEVTITVERSVFTSIEDLEVTASVVLRVTMREGKPFVDGTVTIEEASYEKHLGINDILASLRSFLRRPPRSESRPEDLGTSVGLSIEIKAPGEIFLTTNWAEAELKGRLEIEGTTVDPIIRGGMQTVYGWFKVGSRRFEITSTQLRFREWNSVPEIFMLAETRILSATLEHVFITVEISGSVIDPEVRFSSDTGLSQAEIIRLLSGGQGSTLQAVADFLSSKAGIDLSKRISKVGGSLADIVDFEKFTVDPVINVETGAVEPKIIAEKKLSDDFSLKGETVITPTGGQSTVKGAYDITSRLQAAVSSRIPAGTDQASLGGDLIYQIFPDKKPLKIKINGAEKVDTSTIRRALRISEYSRVPKSRIPELIERGEKLYRDIGFFSVRISVQCDQWTDDTTCREISIEIKEGPESIIEAVELVGDELPDDLKKVLGDAQGKPATEEARSSAVEKLRSALREEGFIGARVRATYNDIGDDQSAKSLSIEAQKGPRSKIVIAGNKEFSDKKLLQTIDFYSRRFPLGVNSITRLPDKITEKYQEAGHPDIKVSLKTSLNQHDVRVFTFTVNEGKRITVDDVVVTGLTTLNDSKLKKLFSKGEREQIFLPKEFERSAISGNITIIKRTLNLNGFPEATVRVSTAAAHASAVTINYHITEGPKRVAYDIHVRGLPEGIENLDLPEETFSEEIVSAYAKRVERLLEDEGYPSAKVTVHSDDNFQNVTLDVSPGPVTVIGTISLKGLTDIEESVVRRHLQFEEGGRWSRKKIDDTRRRLSTLGLFSNVRIVPQDRKIDEAREDLVIQVQERSLQTLEVGGGYDSVYGVHILANGVDRSLFGNGKYLSLRSDLFYDLNRSDFSQGIASLRYNDPYFLDNDTRLSEDLSFARASKTAQEFEVDRISFSSLASKSNGHFSYSFGHSILDEKLSNVEPDVVLSPLDTGYLRLSYLTSSLRYDRRDDPITPRRGYFTSLDLKLSNETIVSDANFYSLQWAGSVLYPTPLFEGRLVLSNATRYGSAWSFGDTSDLPISQRFYLGGASSVRGFRENSLGPRGDLDHVIGGDTFFVNRFETRYAITDSVLALTFLDAGRVMLRSNAGGSDIRLGTGAGVRYLSPVGPIGFDVGHALDGRDGEPSIRFHLSIGASF